MSKKRHKRKEHELQGFKYFKAIPKILESLGDVGCERDRAGNRILHMDQYISLLLLHMFNPICTSLRSLQQASELKKVQKKLGVPRASLGSLSEASTVFDSRRMLEIIEQLGEQLKPIAHHDKLKGLPGILTAVDGTLLKGLPKIAWALWIDDKHKAVKNHVHFEILKGVPVKATITEGNGNEKDVLAATLDAGRIYVLDRGYAKYSLLQKILDHHSSFVCRIRDNYVCEIIEERPITADAEAAGVVRDRIVRLGGNAKSDEITGAVRVVEVKCRPHVKRMHTGRGGPEQSQTIVIATDLLDVEADVIGLIFQHRWTIETFFRFYKHILGCRHLLSYNQNGIELQTYSAIIACMLISLWTGRKPTLRTYEMLCWYFTGMADEEELLSHIQRLQKIG
jgi:Transposase DDE domain